VESLYRSFKKIFNCKAVQLYVYENKQEMIWTFDGNNSMKINEFKSEAGIVGSVIKNKNIVNIGKAKYD